MRKTLSVLMSLCLLCVPAAGCAEKARPSEPAANAAIPDFVDLTNLSSTMVYAEVYNIMTNPAAYVGKTIKAGGAYQATNYYPDGYYHFVLIADAAACCQQGFEFVWAGKHKYPDDYPQDGTQIEVTGVFGRYIEQGNTFYHLTVDEIAVKG
ncbi:MAG: hypothetical protein LBB75_04055 [Oscillospiraceae bacterium]|jgi:hypothetical protein|nr:hypothetical protein [Oscillospiraceae bacterium]